jgi:diguanylate cyclase (GGDEF)-like protein/PAS domain S-box-containing protein
MASRDDDTGRGRSFAGGHRWPEQSRGEGEVDLGTDLAAPVSGPRPFPPGLTSTAKPDFYSTSSHAPTTEFDESSDSEGGWGSRPYEDLAEIGTESLDTVPIEFEPAEFPTSEGNRSGYGAEAPSTGPLPFEFDGLTGLGSDHEPAGTGSIDGLAFDQVLPTGPPPPVGSPPRSAPRQLDLSCHLDVGTTSDGAPGGDRRTATDRTGEGSFEPRPSVDLTEVDRPAEPDKYPGTDVPGTAPGPGFPPNPSSEGSQAERPLPDTSSASHRAPVGEPPTAQLTAVPACPHPPQVRFSSPRTSFGTDNASSPIAPEAVRALHTGPGTSDVAPEGFPSGSPPGQGSQQGRPRSGRRVRGSLGALDAAGAPLAAEARDEIGLVLSDTSQAPRPRPGAPHGQEPWTDTDRSTGSVDRDGEAQGPEVGPSPSAGCRATGRRVQGRSTGAVVAFPGATIPVWRSADGSRIASDETAWFGTSLGRLGAASPAVLQSVLDAVQVGVVVRDPAGATLLTNERGRSLLEPHAGARHPIDVAISNASVHDSVGDVEVVVSTVADVSNERRRERALLLSENKFRATMEHSPTGFAVLSSDGRILEGNESLCRLLGRKASELGGRVLSDLSHPADVERDAGLLAGVLAGTRESCTVERRFLRPSGEVVWVLMSLAAVRDHDRRLRNIVAQLQDITEGKTATQLLSHATLHDPLTGLANRALGLDRIGKALDRGRRHRRPVAVLCCGVDRFKVVNDSIGHACGDAVLVEVAHRLEQALRSSDTAARIAGDEFVVVCEDVQDSREAVLVAERMLAAVREPVTVDGRTVVLTMSVGIALSSPDCDDATALMRDAGTALHRAKENGRSCWHVADDALRRRANDRLEIEQALRSGIGEGDLRLHFQPIVDLQTGRPVGHEALVRWQHPTKGLLGPASFLTVAEETGLIGDIGRWVLMEAARSTALTPGSGYVAVNVSPSQVRRPGLLTEIESVLDRTGLPPSRLVIELTETVMLGAAPAGRTELHRLDDLGVRLVVDDFGTGFSAFSYLRDLPVSGIKVDRSFTAGLGSDPQCDRIVEALTGLARGLGVDLVAEGVETEQQRAFLCRIGCRHAQGYLFGKPLPRAV